MRRAKHAGTNADGSASNEYCSKCYIHGEFTEPEIISAAQMQAHVMSKMQSKGFPKPAAWLFTLPIPKLKRWQHTQW